MELICLSNSICIFVFRFIPSEPISFLKNSPKVSILVPCTFVIKFVKVSIINSFNAIFLDTISGSKDLIFLFILLPISDSFCNSSEIFSFNCRDIGTCFSKISLIIVLFVSFAITRSPPFLSTLFNF